MGFMALTIKWFTTTFLPREKKEASITKYMKRYKLSYPLFKNFKAIFFYAGILKEVCHVYWVKHLGLLLQ